VPRGSRGPQRPERCSPAKGLREMAGGEARRNPPGLKCPSNQHRLLVEDGAREDLVYTLFAACFNGREPGSWVW